MKATAICTWTCAIAMLPLVVQASEHEANYAAYLEGRAAVLDSMSAIVDSLGADYLVFDRPLDRGIHRAWVRRMTEAIEHALHTATEYRAEPTLYHATRFEDAWQRLSCPFARTPEILAVLYAHEAAGLDEGSSPDDAGEREERSARTREVCDFVKAELSPIYRALSRVKLEHGFAYVQYVRAASDELQRTGWHP